MSGFGIVDSGALTNESGIQTMFGSSKLVGEMMSEEDYKRAKELWALYQKAKKWKSRCGAENWGRWWNLWEGKQWARQRPPGLSQAVINVIVETVETQTGHIIDDIPEMVAHARNPMQQDEAAMVTKLLRWVDEINRTDLALEAPVRSTAVTGFAVRRVDWDENMDGGRGAVRYSFVDEDYFFTSPWSVRTDLSDAEYLVEARNVPVSYIRRTWQKGSYVPPGVWDGSLTPLRAVGDNGQMGYSAFTTTDGATTQFSKPKHAEDKTRDLVTLLEFWIREDDGTMRYTAVANGIILQDGPSPYNDDRYPYAIYNFIPQKSSVYGYGIVGFIEKLQVMLNESASYELDQQRYESDSPLVVSQLNIQEGKRLDNLPGKVLVDRTPDGRGYYTLPRPGANGRWGEIEERFLTRIRDISGNVDILRGERPAGVSTLGGMEIIRDEANVLIAKIVKHVTSARQEEASLAISRLRQFFKDSRMVRVSGSGSQDDYIHANKPVGYKASGEMKVSNAIPDDFEADVSFTAEAPGGLQAKFERDMQLLQLGVIDAQAVLEDLEWDPDKIDEILQRVQANQQQALGAQAKLASAKKNPAMAEQMAADSGMQNPEDVMAQAQQLLGTV